MTRYFTSQAKALRTLSGGVHIVRSLVITISVFISHCTLFLLIRWDLEKKAYLFGSTFNGIATFQRTPLFWVTRRTGYMAKVNL